MTAEGTYAVADFPTINDGYVVRWYTSATQPRGEIASASRSGVTATTAPADVVAEAARVHEQIRDWYADGAPSGEKPWADVLTHRAHFLRDDLEPVTEDNR